MNARQIENFITVLGFIDASLLGEWRLLWSGKPGRNFADLALYADSQYIQRLGVIPQLEALGIEVRHLGKKGSKRRWRLLFPDSQLHHQAAMVSRKKFPESVSANQWLLRGDGKPW